MLKEFRNLLQMLDALDEEAPSQPPLPVEPHAVDIPQSVVSATKPASSFIFDTDAAHAATLAAILASSGVDSESFTEASPFVRALLTRPPAMVFLEVSGGGDDAIDVLFAMGERNYAGGVQLMGADASPVSDVVRRMGERHALQMLPVLRKPLEMQAVRDSLVTQNVSIMPIAASLSEALAAGWVEFWYQPKIDLGKRQIAGVETFARVRHPELGTLQPSTFMQGATEADLMLLAQKALTAGLQAASNFAHVGINLQVAINIPVSALFALPVAEMVRELGPKTTRWPGLLLDVTAVQLAADFERLATMGAMLGAANVRLAIDDFGRANLPLPMLRQLPLAELKLDRQFVRGAADDPDRTKICQSVIELAHHLGAVAVAVGIEQRTDLKALVGLGCDVGQGYLFGQPMPEGELVGMLLKRAVAAAPEPPPQRASASAAAPNARLKRAVWT